VVSFQFSVSEKREEKVKDRGLLTPRPPKGKCNELVGHNTRSETGKGRGESEPQDPPSQTEEGAPNFT
jgi:hypothetical protein